MTINFTPTKLKLVRPVPSDIDIAQAADIKPISQVAEEAGILPEELEFYGPYKAKVKLEVLKRRNCHYTHPARGRQDHHHSWTMSGTWRISWQKGIYSHPPTLTGANLWY
jgi:hypothetical protein